MKKIDHLKPENSGDIRFIADPQNEIAKGLFHKEKLNLGLLFRKNIFLILIFQEMNL